MSSLADRPIHTLADLIERLGRVPLDRVRFHPPPGTATEQDVLGVAEREDRLCELKDGVLVEKVMGYGESILAVFIARMLGDFVSARNLGHVTGEQGMVRLFPGLIRIPDVAFASWERFPERRWAGEAIPDVVPDLAVEVFSDSNTEAEMKGGSCLTRLDGNPNGVASAWTQCIDVQTRLFGKLMADMLL